MTKVFILTFLISFSLATKAQINPLTGKPFPVSKHTSKGSMSFKFNGQPYEADPAHAKGYAMVQTGLGYINGANSSKGILIGLELFVKGKGAISIKGDKDGKVNFTINNVMYWVKSPGDFLNVEITNVKKMGQLLLLSGTFEGVVQDKEGHKAKITEGKFSTESL
ncbi:MAG: hypothetical protein JST10_00870 [Bacteroidetes bacterium]|nr:hypothetical protein [Bacteroidota bacterium]MBS1631102.1 hypothetical protein [Bacteroidota bacterium]